MFFQSQISTSIVFPVRIECLWGTYPHQLHVYLWTPCKPSHVCAVKPEVLKSWFLKIDYSRALCLGADQKVLNQRYRQLQNRRKHLRFWNSPGTASRPMRHVTQIQKVAFSIAWYWELMKLEIIWPSNFLNILFTDYNFLNVHYQPLQILLHVQYIRLLQFIKTWCTCTCTSYMSSFYSITY